MDINKFKEKLNKLGLQLVNKPKHGELYCIVTDGIYNYNIQPYYIHRRKLTMSMMTKESKIKYYKNKNPNYKTREERKLEKKITIENKIKNTLGDYYDYSKLNFIKSRIKVVITCPKHGDFSQITTEIFRKKRGCQKCSYENKEFGKKGFLKNCKNNEGTLYIISCYDEKENFYKIGITSKSVFERFNDNKSLPYEYKSILVFKSTAETIYDLEKKLHKINYDKKYQPLKKFNGCQECYSDLNLENIRSILKTKNLFNEQY